MRLGGFFAAESVEELERLCDRLDAYGLSAIRAPDRLRDMTTAECETFGGAARRLGVVIGEYPMGINLMTRDAGVRSERIDRVRVALRKADAMGCRAVYTLVGTRDPSDHPLAPSRDGFTPEFAAEFREVVLRIVDGLELTTTTYLVEPWCTTFFYRPDDIRSFLDSVDDSRVGLHLDLMNMVSLETFFSTTELIDRTFELLSDSVRAVHFKDIAWDHKHMFLKWDEVPIGQGVIDYDTYLRRASELPTDTSCFCEHLADEGAYAVNFARLHELASRAGVRFLPRREPA